MLQRQDENKEWWRTRPSKRESDVLGSRGELVVNGNTVKPTFNQAVQRWPVASAQGGEGQPGAEGAFSRRAAKGSAVLHTACYSALARAATLVHMLDGVQAVRSASRGLSVA